MAAASASALTASRMSRSVTRQLCSRLSCSADLCEWIAYGQCNSRRRAAFGSVMPSRAVRGRLCSLRGARPSGARHVLDRCDLSARTTLSPPAQRASYRVTPPACTQTPHQLKVAIACLSLRRDSQRPFSSLSFCRCLHHAVTLCPWECMCSCVMSSVCGICDGRSPQPVREADSALGGRAQGGTVRCRVLSHRMCRRCGAPRRIHSTHGCEQWCPHMVVEGRKRDKKMLCG